MLFPLLFSMSLLTAIPGTDVRFPVEKDLPAQTIRDVAYGKDPFQRMDIYLPQGRSAKATKSIILIHGGGWNSGNKSEFNSYIDSFKTRLPAYAIFNLNYRLVNDSNLFPTQEEDIKKALDFITGNIKEYSINKSKFVLLGASAGAHLALLQSYKYNEPGIAAVIDFFGPSDLTVMYQQPWHPMVPYALQLITGTNPTVDPELYRQSSPVNFITSASAPTLIFHGANDNVVDVSQSRLLKRKLDDNHVPNEMVLYPGQRHGWHGATLSNSFDRIEAFLKTNVK
jgi:acetyl esterase/lipase